MVETGMRPKTVMEMQPYMFGYGLGISLFSPMATLYQVCQLNPQLGLKPAQMPAIAMRILPQQVLLKVTQMNLSTPVKEQLNPWAAFAAVGVLQGGVYGQATIYFARTLKLGKEPSYMGMFRGAAFAGGRDLISQGVPFVLSSTFREAVLDPLYPTHDNPEGPIAKAKQWGAVLATSTFATYASQGLHNCQLTMQANQELSYAQTLKKAVSENGVRLLYKGAEARVGLLLIVNILNELLLKPAWAPVPVDASHPLETPDKQPLA
mmetsp:Transcript_16310/g.28894  ORF Transcript_16310/g.28894 Transcript_16310/m.28894 type:complete len:264 (-) Transcript_16310:134-925(-)